MQLARRQITYLLNALYTDSITSVSVWYPCEEIGEHLKIGLSDAFTTMVRFTQGALTYQDSREELHTTYGQQAYDDLPDKDFLMSGWDQNAEIRVTAVLKSDLQIDRV